MLHKLVQFDLSAAVDVTLCKQLVNNGLSVLVVNTLLGEERVELLLAHLTRPINIDLCKFLPELLKFLRRDPITTSSSLVKL